ncbi:hypothetical protein GUJ93_ZPchr0006g41806 [Zizania palustris]|uniref:Uncharacterized protein n=1 Tax=Zizania palustris TaxID=103762 RepID=A0A8J5W1R5_ZIZPA|nr:hypothetical protein GUJ93_ZPchr0006g41806 [Zizania palustris]
MAKKRKRASDAPAATSDAVQKPDDSAPPRPERTLFGFKDKPSCAGSDPEPASEGGGGAASPPFRNKEKVSASDAERGVTAAARQEGQQGRVEAEQGQRAQRVARAQELLQLPLLRVQETEGSLPLDGQVPWTGGPSVKFLVNAGISSFWLSVSCSMNSVDVFRGN